MKTKRITGFLALTVLATAGMLLPLGLSGQTNDVGHVSLGGGPAAQPIGMSAQAPYMGGMPQYMTAEPSVAAYGTSAMPQYFGPDSGVGFNMTDPTSTQLFGPQLNFDANFGEGLGYSEEYFRLNAMVPWHLVPGQTVLLLDVAASVTDEGRGTYNGGVAYRNLDAARNRIFGWNAYYDLDQGTRRDEGYHRLGVGVESLGKYLDFRVNGYFVLGTENEEISSQLTGTCDFIGHNIVATRERLLESAFSGIDAETGGPLPFLGHYGINGYVGGYYLDNDEAGDTVGVSARVEALINDATTANFTYTNDDLLGDNAYASVSVTLPRWRTRGWFKPRVLQERLGDQVRRSNRIHTDVATFRNNENVVNPQDGQAFELLFVDPNRTVNGDGSVENPFSSLEALAAANASRFDILSVAPRTDNTSTNLSVDGGLDLFAGQQLLGREKSHRIFESDGLICDLPSLVDDPEILAPLITNPSGGPGSQVISLSDNNVVSGFRIDANGGRGIVSRNPLTDFEITCNTIFNHTDAVVLNNVQGRGVFTDNTIIGEDEDGNQSAGNGLLLTVAAGETLNLLAENNTITGHTGNGIDLLARPGSRIQANDPAGNLGERTGILGNVTDNNNRGIDIEARDGAVVNASVEDNQFNNNTRDGFRALADGGSFVLRSFARNTGSSNGDNGVFFHYRNGGRFTVITEDRNENGVFEVDEDVNGNGLFDQGFVQNVLDDNGLNGLCIFGQGSGSGVFDIGGPDESLGNTFTGNLGSGIAIDTTGTARVQTDILFNTITSPGTNSPFVSQDQGGLTVVLDFFDLATQGAQADSFGFNLTGFDITSFGFAPDELEELQTAVLAEVIRDFRGIVTSDVDPRSPIPAGQELAIDFVIGDIGGAPSNGSTEFYTHFISGTDTAGAPLGLGVLGGIRDQTGVGPNFGFVNGDHVSSTYSSEFPQLDGTFGITPGDALTSGNLEFTTFALAGTISHEVGHNLSLNHVDPGAITPSGSGNAIMGTGATGRPNQQIIEDAEFSLSGVNAETGGTPSMNIQQLVDAVGLRTAIPIVGPSGEGITIRSADNSRLEPSRILNNNITNLQGDAISVTALDNAKAEALDIQGNNIEGNGGRGIHLEARGPGAMIFADQSIGGDGFNSLGGNSFTQRNVITNNIGDGIQVLAANGGMINGNVINNEITANAGNGIALLIERFGTLDFGDVSDGNNRIIRDNIITDNGGFGILTRTESVPGELTVAKVITENNQITGNAEGGFLADLTGSNNSPPAAAAPVTNSTLDLTIRNEVFDGNDGVGIAVHTAGNTKANVLIEDSTIINTQNGTLGGDGIDFLRADSSFLEALVLNNNVSNNFGSGMETTFVGNNRFDVNQPMSGSINTVTWNGNTFEFNGANGVAFFGRGDAQLLGDGMNNVISNNSSNGILVDTREFSTFGDPSDFGFDPPGRRTVFKSNVITENAGDGIRLTSFNDSRQLVQVTSAASSTSTNPHVSGATDGDTVISNNGSDGIHIEATDDSDIDLLVDSGDGQTFITDNGSLPNGGNGIRFDASGNTNSTLTVQGVLIAGSVAGLSEDANGNGVLDFGEDANMNGFLDTEDADGNGNLDAGEDANGNGVLDTEDLNGNGLLDGSEDASNLNGFIAGNLDIDVQNGDGIQFNSLDNSTATLQVGGTGDRLGNIIQANGDDGVAVVARGGLSALGSGGTGQSRPTVNVVGNLVGGSNNGNPAGNGGDGVDINISGGAFAAAQFDGTVNADNQPDISPPDQPAFFRNEIGPIVTATITDNEFSQNIRRGANFRVTGASGQREREILGGTGPSGTTLDTNLFVFNDNVVRSNGLDGVVFQANARYLESREVFIPGNGAPGAGNLRAGLFSPFDPQLLALNVGTLNGQAAYQANFLNLRTAQNSLFESLNNEITNNGTSLAAGLGTGMTIRVSPNAYLAADVQNTAFGGNLDADFFTESFNVGGDPLSSIDQVNADGTEIFNPDVVFLDDTAQLDLRFNNNSGNQIDVTSAGFAFTNIDPSKGFLPRNTSLFQVDNGPLLSSPNNIFSFQGSVQDIRTEFNSNGFNERAAADPLFPNIDFPPVLP